MKRFLKEELLNKEMNFMELDNYMVNNGYYTVSDDGAFTEIKEDLNVCYTSQKTGEIEVQINFKIIYDNGKDEGIDCFILKIIEIENFAKQQFTKEEKEEFKNIIEK